MIYTFLKSARRESDRLDGHHIAAPLSLLSKVPQSRDFPLTARLSCRGEAQSCRTHTILLAAGKHPALQAIDTCYCIYSYWLAGSQCIYTMQAENTTMKVRDIIRGASEKELLIPAKVCAPDKQGRIYVGVDHARKKGLLLFVALSDEEMAEIEGR